MSKVPRLCLNMIVKNESAIIIRLLQSVIDYIDTFCICDTGSEDNTIALIQYFFKEHNKTGVLFEEPFQDFGYNRSLALEKCCQMQNVDYILLLDADMKLFIHPSVTPIHLKKHLLKSDSFYILQGNPQFQYKNIRIVKKHASLHYWGVTHEYIVLPKEYTSKTLEKDQVFINDIGDGGSKQNKYTRDIALLKKGLEKHVNHPRYLFYLANSYRNSGMLNEAIENYEKRVQAGGWIEEVWYSYYCMGNCFQEQNKISHAIQSWLNAYNAFPNRIENLYKIVHIYRNTQKYKLALLFYDIAKKTLEKYPRITYLFMENDIYDYKLDYEYSIIAYYVQENKPKLCNKIMNLLHYPYMPTSIGQNILSNYKFYVSKIIKNETQTFDTLFQAFRDAILPNHDGFFHSTPSFTKINDTTYALNVRYVNYHIDIQGNYHTKDHIISKNLVSIIEYKTQSWKITSQNWLDYNTCHDDFYVGLEDVRLFSNDQDPFFPCYTCNRGIVHRNIVVEKGKMDISLGKTRESVLLNHISKKSVEKNWVFLGNQQREIVYSYFPLSIGVIEDELFRETFQHPTPRFFENMRGSCHGIVIENEIWLLCHYVSHESRRHYYHCFLVLETTTRRPLKHSIFFTFEKSPVEYCLGALYEKKEFLFGYSILDKTTQFISIPKSYFDTNMIPLDKQ